MMNELKLVVSGEVCVRMVRKTKTNDFVCLFGLLMNFVPARKPMWSSNNSTATVFGIGTSKGKKCSGMSAKMSLYRKET